MMLKSTHNILAVMIHIYSHYFCQYIGQLRMQCIECENFSLCGECFCAGVNLPPHENTHSYTVSDCLEVPIFTKDWTISEELMLLDGIEKHGVGNWKMISEYINNNNNSNTHLNVSKSIKQVEEHYWELYMGIHGYCLPQNVLLYDTTVSSEQYIRDKGLPSDINQTDVIDTYNRSELVVRDKGKESKAKDKQEIREKIALLPGSDLTGYIPLREDFDVEYENDAECILADMEFNADDHPSEKELKLQVVKIYNQKLSERDRRKRFVIDRGLVDFKKQVALDRRRSKEEREIVAKLRMFARFHSPEEHEALVDGVLKARRLRQQIGVYQQYRKMGIRTIEQARQYEIDRKKRDQESKQKKMREGTSYLFETGQSKKLTGRRSRGSLEDDDDSGGVEVYAASLKSTSSSSRNTDPSKVVLDISKAPSAELLSEKELELCCEIPMLPLHYLAAKDAIVREAFRNGILTKEGVHRVLKLDSGKIDTFFDFFVREMTVTEDIVSYSRQMKKKKTEDDEK